MAGIVCVFNGTRLPGFLFLDLCVRMQRGSTAPAGAGSQKQSVVGWLVEQGPRQRGPSPTVPEQCKRGRPKD